MIKKQEKEVTEGKLIRPLNAYKDKALTITNQKDVATFHRGEQGELEDVIEHVELELSKVIGKQLVDVVELKSPWELIWDLIENLAFWY